LSPNLATNYMPQKRSYNLWQALLVHWRTLLCIAFYSWLLVWYIKAKRFHRFIDYIIWVSASETPNEPIQQTLISAFVHIGLELKLSYIYFFKSKMCSDFTKTRQTVFFCPLKVFWIQATVFSIILSIIFSVRVCIKKLHQCFDLSTLLKLFPFWVMEIW